MKILIHVELWGEEIPASYYQKKSLILEKCNQHYEHMEYI